jgi:tRNA(Ile)-lysidine synthase
MARGASRPVAAPWPDGAGAVCVGFSGGLDSTVLLHALHESARESSGILTAVHVHHGLSPNADAWAASCRERCARLGVALDIVRVSLDRESGLGLEAEARRARYAVYASRPEPYVALAHHHDDQVETTLLQLFRGTGLKGVAAMPRLRALTPRVTLYRPFLATPRAALEAYAREKGLEWIEDESNAGRAQDRNFIRHEVAALLDTRFPAWRDSVARFSSHAADAQSLLDELARLDGLPAQAGHALPLDAGLTPSRRSNLLRAFLALNGLAMPAEARLAEMARQLWEAREDARVLVRHDEVAVTRHRGRARIEPLTDAPARIPWHGEAHVDLGEPHGSVDFESGVGAGLAASRVGTGRWFFAPRSGGERLRLGAGRPSRTLRNLLQEHGLSAGERERLPLLFHDDALVWVPGIGIAAEYACAPGEPGLKPCWRVAGKSPLC